ncbi:MAG: hypothetical protein LUD14_04555 [Clostridiales bacterium]|nr:hypothetical protein [Clostridiales bacterium]
MQVIDVTLRESVYYESGMSYEDRLQYLRDLCELIPNDFLQYVEICFIDNDVDKDLNYDEKFIRDAYYGIKVACNLLYAGSAPMEIILKMEKEADAMGVDYFDCADSSGSFTPTYTDELSKNLMAYRGNLEIGLHLHDHMRMALANALVAQKNGVELADVSILGAGKGGGNMKMEEALLLLYGKEIINYNLLHGLSRMIEEFCNMVSKNPKDDSKAFINYLTGVFKLNLKDIETLEKKSQGNSDIYLKCLLGEL